MRVVVALVILASACSKKDVGRTWSADERQIVDDYMRTEPVKRLQVGAGGRNIKGWLNTDLEPMPGEVFLDAGAQFPFPDKTFKYIYAEQLIEHLTYGQALMFVRESFRVLQPGGRIRLTTPDLLLLIALYTETKTPLQQKVLDVEDKFNGFPKTVRRETAWFNMLNHRWGHQFLYDPESLKMTLETAGFTTVTPVKLGESDAQDLQNIEMHWQIGGKDVDEATSQYVEATRP